MSGSSSRSHEVSLSVYGIRASLPQWRNPQRLSVRLRRKARLEQAKPQHFEVATQRYTALAAFQQGRMPPDVSRRSIQRWQKQYREGEVKYGNGYLGLLPEWSACGNRLPRLDQEVEELLEHFIANTYETLKQQPMREVYLLFERTVRDKHLPVPSYTTFQQRIAERSSADATRKRYGPRAAAAEEWYWEIEPTTPPHGTRPWGVAHIDHTQLDIELVGARTGRSPRSSLGDLPHGRFHPSITRRLHHVRSAQLSLGHDGLTRMCLALWQTAANHRRRWWS